MILRARRIPLRTATPTALILVFGLALSHAQAAGADAQPRSGYSELLQALESAIPYPSVDTTPVKFSISDVNFTLPRNYITAMDDWSGGPQHIVTIALNFPDLSPKTSENSACFAHIGVEKRFSCWPLDILLEEASDLSEEQRLRNVLAATPGASPKTGPYGYTIYNLSLIPDGATLYTKMTPEGLLMFDCVFDEDVQFGRIGLCRLAKNYSDHTSLLVRFDDRLLPDIEQVVFNVRHILEDHKSSDQSTQP